ncbi:hypothetical protein [Nonomuraea dietziae]|uniref:hypothetical protein n=1 Tax=Nonomuraea dietziae TaxID=65515 RepID=UPI003CD0628B
MAVVPSGHPLAERQAISLRDLGAYPIVWHAARHRPCARCSTARAPRRTSTPRSHCRPAPRTPSPTSPSGGSGVAVPQRVDGRAPPRPAHRPAPADVETPALLALVWKSAHGPAVREFLRYGRRAFAGPSPADRADREASS